MKILGWLFLILLVIGGVSAFSKMPPASPTSTTATVKQATADTLAVGDKACMAKWLKSEKAGITHGEGMVDGHMEVMVDEATYSLIDYATKVGMAQTFQCAVVGKTHALTEVLFVSNMTGKVLATWSWNKLTVQ